MSFYTTKEFVSKVLFYIKFFSSVVMYLECLRKRVKMEQDKEFEVDNQPIYIYIYIYKRIS